MIGSTGIVGGIRQALSLHKSCQNNNEIGYNEITTTATRAFLSTACGLAATLALNAQKHLHLSPPHRHIVSIVPKFDSISALNISKLTDFRQIFFHSIHFVIHSIYNGQWSSLPRTWAHAHSCVRHRRIFEFIMITIIMIMEYECIRILNGTVKSNGTKLKVETRIVQTAIQPIVS